MESGHNVELTASEISQLWISYQNDSMAACVLKYFLANTDDKEIYSVLEYALEISVAHVQKATQFFKNENYPIPQGFTEQDVNLEAPRLFSDRLYLEYILNMGNFGLASYGLAISLAERTDIIEYYNECLNETQDLHNKAKELSKEKGVYVRTPHIPKSNQIDFVKKQSFLAGWFGDRRPLLGVEIAQLAFNAKRNALGQAIIMGFSQVAQSKEVRRFFERGREIAGKHLEIFTSLLHKDYLAEGAFVQASEVTDSKISSFSDKLIMYHISALVGSGMGQYGIAISTSPRHDLGTHYGRLILELVQYSNDGAKIMINNGWMDGTSSSCRRKKRISKVS